MAMSTSKRASSSSGGPKANAARHQVFLPEYTRIPAIVASTKGPNHAYCEACKSDFSISHSGSYDIETHIGGPRHKDKFEVSH